MKDELVWALAFDFPRLYTGLRKTYTYAHFQGVNCADGWEPIVRWLSGQIERLIELESLEEQELYRAIEVRERHGGLEFYMNDATEDMQKLIGSAVAESFSVCEFCGHQGVLRQPNRRGPKTLCSDCFGKVIVLPAQRLVPNQRI
ncbi:MAG: hypothetical protein IAF58_13155 [Leptolyngbya sp.]|nr:hypothetical protein [Candidatus Melainabacteria bacterium]